jgi:hypothetical protein
MVLEFYRHRTFEELTQEGQVGDRPVVLEFVMVRPRLFEYWCDCIEFDLRRDTSSGEGLVDDFCEERLQSRYAGLDKEGGDWVKLTGGGPHCPNQLGYISCSDCGEGGEP